MASCSCCVYKGEPNGSRQTLREVRVQKPTLSTRLGGRGEGRGGGGERERRQTLLPLLRSGTELSSFHILPAFIFLSRDGNQCRRTHPPLCRKSSRQAPGSERAPLGEDADSERLPESHLAGHTVTARPRAPAAGSTAKTERVQDHGIPVRTPYTTHVDGTV